MPFERLEFTRDWRNPVDFPTTEANETKVREDMQCLHDETRDALNALMDDLEQGTNVAPHAPRHAADGDDPVTPASIGAVPTTRKVNGKALSADVTLTNSDVNAAPAGFGGFGEVCPTISATTEDALHTGLNALLATMPDVSMCGVRLVGFPNNNPWFGVLKKQSNIRATLDVSTYGNGETTYYTKSLKDTWSQGEWVNPPMVVGTEYRTTERWNGKPVYVKLVNFGNLPNTTSKDVGVGASDVEEIVWCNTKIGYSLGGSKYYDFVLSATTGGINAVTTAYVGENNTATIRITTKENISGWVASVQIKYTKTTD